MKRRTWSSVVDAEINRIPISNNHSPSKKYPMEMRTIPKRTIPNASTVPMKLAMRVAVINDPVHVQNKARITRPPSNGKHGKRYRAANAKLEYDKYSVHAITKEETPSPSVISLLMPKIVPPTVKDDRGREMATINSTIGDVDSSRTVEIPPNMYTMFRSFLIYRALATSICTNSWRRMNRMNNRAVTIPASQ